LLAVHAVRRPAGGDGTDDAERDAAMDVIQVATSRAAAGRAAPSGGLAATGTLAGVTTG